MTNLQNYSEMEEARKVGRLGHAPKILKMNALRVTYFPKIVLLGLFDRSIRVFDCSIREYRS